jgi:hypothetical protein
MKSAESASATGTKTLVPDARVQVVFTQPEKFLDVRDSNDPTEKGEGEILDMFRRYVIQRADIYLPEGDGLYVNFINIKVAGVFPGIGKRRIISPGTLPIFVFEWAITDRSGRVIKKGSETLEERSFMELYSNNGLDHEPFHYDQAVLDDWMHNNLQI